ncbi:MAG: hypothetical protein PUE68_04525, partial [Kiritimatiellae bacterium]|nr:hypothetical protein [Kiritimatiellia bacterium]
KYKTIMRYKALAKRLRQAAGISDPVPTSAVYDGVAAEAMPPPLEGRREHYALNSRLVEARRRLGACGNVLAEVWRAAEDWAATGVPEGWAATGVPVE